MRQRTERPPAHQAGLPLAVLLAGLAASGLAGCGASLRAARRSEGHSPSVPAGPWRGEPDLDEASLPRDPAALPSLVVRWRRPRPEGEGGQSLSPTLWPEGRTVVLSDPAAGQLLGLDLDDGSELWRTPLPSDGPSSHEVSVLDGGFLYRSWGRGLVALDLREGRPVWQVDLPGAPVEGAEPALTSDGMLVLVLEAPGEAHDGGADRLGDLRALTTRIAAIDTRTGAIAWSLEPGGESRPRLDAVGELVVVGRDRLREGGAAWSELTLYRGVDGSTVTARVVEDHAARILSVGEVLVVQTSSRLEGLSGSTLETLWDQPAPEVLELLERAGSFLLEQVGTTLRRIDPSTGGVADEVDLAAVLGPEATSACIGDLDVAGNSLIFSTSPGCASRRIVLLRADTLRPWRVIMPPREGVDLLDSSADTAILATATEVLAMALEDVGPSIRETLSFRERIVLEGREIERGELALGWPLEGRARELALGGPEIGPAAVETLERGTLPEQLFTATVLTYQPVPRAVPGLLALFRSSVARGTDETSDDAELYEQLFWRSLDALARCGDPLAAPLLCDLVTEPRWPWGARSIAMQGLAAVGTPEALATIDQHREERTRRSSPWSPHVDERTAGRHFDDGAILGSAASASSGAATRAESADHAVVALVAFAAGGPSDLWLLPAVHGGSALFTGVTSTSGLGIHSVSATGEGAELVIERSPSGPACAVCAAIESETRGGGDDHERRGLVRQRVVLRWDDLTRDTDRDGWTDLLERRLHTDARLADTDGDALPDPLDPAPRGAGPSPDAGCAREAVFPAAFFAEFGFIEGQDPVFVEGPAEVNLQHEGYPGPVIYLSYEEAEQLRAEVGLDGSTYFSFAQRREVGVDGERHAEGSPLDEVRFSDDGRRATLEVRAFRGSLNAEGRRIELTCLGGRWYALSSVLTWTS